MNNFMAVVASTFLAVSPVFASALTISATPDVDVSLLEIGDVFSVAYQSESFPSFSGGDLSVNYDPSLISATSISFGSNWLLTTATVPPTTLGEISPISFSTLVFPEVSGTVELFTIEFSAIAAGTSAISASEIFGGFVGIGFVDPTFDFDSLSFKVADPAVTVSTIPLPSSVFFSACGLMFLVRVRRKGKFG